LEAIVARNQHTLRRMSPEVARRRDFRSKDAVICTRATAIARPPGSRAPL
jgi:hypothetical protein